jgi:hypothetical protein
MAFSLSTTLPSKYSTGLRGSEAEEKLEQYKKTDMVKNMLFVGPEGETLDVDGSVVGKEKDMRENPRTNSHNK